MKRRTYLIALALGLALVGLHPTAEAFSVTNAGPFPSISYTDGSIYGLWAGQGQFDSYSDGAEVVIGFGSSRMAFDGHGNLTRTLFAVGVFYSAPQSSACTYTGTGTYNVNADGTGTWNATLTSTSTYCNGVTLTDSASFVVNSTNKIIGASELYTASGGNGTFQFGSTLTN